jgi:hypothetical protein
MWRDICAVIKKYREINGEQAKAKVFWKYVRILILFCAFKYHRSQREMRNQKENRRIYSNSLYKEAHK